MAINRNGLLMILAGLALAAFLLTGDPAPLLDALQDGDWVEWLMIPVPAWIPALLALALLLKK